MSLYLSRSADSFLRTQINPYNPPTSIPESPTIDDFKQVQDDYDTTKTTPNINNEALESFLNIFKQT